MLSKDTVMENLFWGVWQIQEWAQVASRRAVKPVNVLTPPVVPKPTIVRVILVTWNFVELFITVGLWMTSFAFFDVFVSNVPDFFWTKQIPKIKSA